MDREWTIIITMITVTIVMGFVINFLALPILCNYDGHWSINRANPTFDSITYNTDCEIQARMNQAISFWDMNSARNVFDANSTGVISGTPPSTPIDYLAMLTGSAINAFTNFVSKIPLIGDLWKAAGVFWHLSSAIVNFAGSFQIIAFYFVFKSAIPPVFAALIGIFAVVFTVMQGLAAFYLVSYIASIIRGARAVS